MDILKKTALAFLMSKKNINFILLELLSELLNAIDVGLQNFAKKYHSWII